MIKREVPSGTSLFLYFNPSIRELLMTLFDISHSTSLPGQAAIDFQISSSLGKSLTALFQTVIDYRDNLDYSSVPDTVHAHRTYRIDKVYAFFKEKICQKFMDIVDKETGLIIKKINMIGGETAGVCGYFAVDLSFHDWRASIEMQNRMTGNNHGQWRGSKEAAQELAEMAKQLDLSTGKIKKPVYGKNRKIQVSIYFDINTAFLVEDFLPAKFAKPFTAGEIAAIMMHEIGHALTMVEHSADTFATQTRAQSAIQYLKKDKDPKGAVNETCKVLLPAIKELKKTISTSDKSGTTVIKIANTLEAGFKGLQAIADTENLEEESWFYTIGSFTGNMILLALSFLCNIYINLCFFAVGGSLLHEIGRLSYVDVNTGNDKTSDLKSNFNNTFKIERWADEYVTRHGFGAELASGLNKLDDYFKYGVLGDITSSRLRNSTLFGCICMCYGLIIDKMMIVSYLDPQGYENQFNRLSRVLQNTYGFFKGEPVPGIAVDQWIKSVEVIKTQMQEAKTLSDTEVGKACYNTLRNLISPVRWVQLVYDGNLARDTEIMANQVDAMSNNPFFFISSKLKSMR